jgi:hypothetical protein
MNDTGHPAVAVAESLKTRCAPTEPRYRVPAAGIRQQCIGKESDENPHRSRPPEVNHPGSLSHAIARRLDAVRLSDWEAGTSQNTTV